MLGLDRKGITAVTMPCFGTTDRTYNNACELAKSYGATLVEINIKDSVRQHFKDIGHDENIHDVTYENSQARERTQILMDIANQKNGIVIGTGDLSELAIGWATYNGDHMSMYAVNASVPKTLVRYLVSYEADIREGKLKDILLDILDTPVSPELLPPEENGDIAQKTEAKNRVVFGSNQITNTINIGTRMMISNRVVYRITNINDFEQNGKATGDKGAVTVLILETAIIKEDDLENNIAYNKLSIEEPDINEIEGKDSINLGEKNTYSIDYNNEVKYSIDTNIDEITLTQTGNKCYIKVSNDMNLIGESILLIVKDKDTDQTIDMKTIIIRGN